MSADLNRVTGPADQLHLIALARQADKLSQWDEGAPTFEQSMLAVLDAAAYQYAIDEVVAEITAWLEDGVDIRNCGRTVFYRVVREQNGTYTIEDES